MYQLTKREKWMLFVLALVLLVVGGYLLLLAPAMDARLALQQQLQEEQMKQVEMLADIADADNAAQQRIDAKAQAQMAAAAFYEPLSNDQLTEVCRGFMDSHDLAAASMQFSGVQVSTITPLTRTQTTAPTYAYEQHLNAAEGVDGGEAGDEAAAAPAEAGAEVLCNTATIAGVGNEADVRALLADLAGRMPIEVQSFTLTPGANAPFTITMNFYMLKQVA